MNWGLVLAVGIGALSGGLMGRFARGHDRKGFRTIANVGAIYLGIVTIVLLVAFARMD